VVAHLLTGVRLFLVPLSVLAFADRLSGGPLWPAVFVALAIVTDHLDGIAARSRGTASPGGQVFDHTTDFLFVTGSLGGAAAAGLVPWALPVLVVVAFVQYVTDSFVLHRLKELRMSRLGRWNGILYFAPLVGIALFRLPVPSGVAAALRTLVVATSWVLAASTVASIMDRALAPPRVRDARPPSPRSPPR
jgi:phosphatidylglycerophosphate synthase